MYKSFQTTLGLEECKKIFDRSIGAGYSDEYIGKRRGEEFLIKKLSKTYSNSFARNYYGRFVQNEKGTCVMGRFEINKGMKYLINFFYATIFVCFIISIVKFIIGFSNTGAIRKFLWEIFSFGWMFALLQFGIRRAIIAGKDGENYIINRVKLLFDAKEID